MFKGGRSWVARVCAKPVLLETADGEDEKERFACLIHQLPNRCELGNK